MARTTKRMGDQRRTAGAPVKDNLNSLPASVGITPEDRQKYAEVNSLSSLNNVERFLNGYTAEDITENLTPARLNRVLIIGCVWLVTQRKKWAETEQEQLAPLFGHAVSYLRLAGRLFARRLDINGAVAFYRTNSERFKFRATKAEGIGFTWDCLRAYDVWLSAGGEEAGESALRQIDVKLVRAPRPRAILTDEQRAIRWALLYCRLMQETNKREVTLPEGANAVTDILNWVERIPWDEERDGDLWRDNRDRAIAAIDVPDSFIERTIQPVEVDAGGEGKRESEGNGGTQATGNTTQTGGGSNISIDWLMVRGIATARRVVVETLARAHVSAGMAQDAAIQRAVNEMGGHIADRPRRSRT